MTAVEDTPSVADTPASPAAPPSPPLSDALAVVVAGRTLRACQHQVAGHLFENGKAGSLVDGEGRFYKPLQLGPRGDRELAFYTRVAAALAADGLAWRYAAAAARRWRADGVVSQQVPLPPASWAAANAPLLAALPVFHGVLPASPSTGGRRLLGLDDVAARCGQHPAVIDIKIGARTWYAGAPADHVAKCAAKDAATTQAELGFRVCGAQSYNPALFGPGCRRLDKAASKALTRASVPSALAAWASNGGAATPASVFGGSSGAAAQLRQLAAWFGRQTEFAFYSASVLIVYDGGAGVGVEAAGGGHAPASLPCDPRPCVYLCDFAHTFAVTGARDTNFEAGLTSLVSVLDGVAAADAVADALG